jgi:hypothetical protein
MIDNEYYDGDYLLRLKGRKTVLDAEDKLSCFGRWINDSLSKNKTNCKFQQLDKTLNSTEGEATKNIAKGLEIYAEYGLNHDDMINDLLLTRPLLMRLNSCSK